MYIPAMQPGHVASNAEIMANFHCACEGGIRPANATDSIVLVLNHTKHPHSDDWHGDTLWFQGSGSNGDQTLEKGRNRTLLAAFSTARPVYLFEVFKPQKYTFRGRVELAGKPFESSGADSAGKERKIWVFPLKIADNPEAGQR